MFKVCEIIGILKIEFFNVCIIERAKAMLLYITNSYLEFVVQFSFPRYTFSTKGTQRPIQPYLLFCKIMFDNATLTFAFNIVIIVTIGNIIDSNLLSVFP